MPFRPIAPSKDVDTTSLQGLGKSVTDLAQWAYVQFNSVASSFQSTEPIKVWHSAPPKPRVGTIAYADGTNWNPGSFEGPYYFASGGGWWPMADSFNGSGQFELGAPPLTESYIDFHSCSTAYNDYDARLASIGGTAGTSGTGSFSIAAAQCTVSCPMTTQGVHAAGPSGQFNADIGYLCRAGENGATSNTFNFFWNGSALHAWVDVTDLGAVQMVSDYRTKKDIQDAPRATAEVLQWRPITYTGASWGIFEEHDTLRWGFVAHELQAVSPDCVEGEKDGEHPQTLVLLSMVSRLTKTVQELEARIRKLEMQS